MWGKDDVSNGEVPKGETKEEDDEEEEEREEECEYVGKVEEA